MSKLRQDVRAFRQRIKMGRTRLWVVVEGVDHDRVFYERVLEASARGANSQISVRLAEDISIGAVAAGGKAHALALYKYFEETEALVQRNGGGKVSISFFVDRDDDEYTGKLLNNYHVVYTKHSDVEAEIFAYGNAYRSAAATLGLPYGLVRELADETGSPLDALASIWREWIRLRLVSAACEVNNGARFGQPSQIHDHPYGPLNEAAAEEVLRGLAARVDDGQWAVELARVDEYLGSVFGENRQSALVKGKWVAGYLRHLIEARLPDERMRAKFSDHAVVTTCLESISFSDPWIEYYRERVTALLAS